MMGFRWTVLARHRVDVLSASKPLSPLDLYGVLAIATVFVQCVTNTGAAHIVMKSVIGADRISVAIGPGCADILIRRNADTRDADRL
ncbi:MAG: hypothetical protein AAGF88_11405 [Pseudomonadota bacterium]